MTYEEFAKKHNLKFSFVSVIANPNMADMPEGSYHFQCMIAAADRKKSMVIPYSMGPGWSKFPGMSVEQARLAREKAERTRKPTLADVLDCLVSGYVTPHTRFEDWARDLGYDEDSRKAEKIFKACMEQSDALLMLLGEKGMIELLDCERL